MSCQQTSQQFSKKKNSSGSFDQSTWDSQSATSNWTKLEPFKYFQELGSCTHIYIICIWNKLPYLSLGFDAPDETKSNQYPGSQQGQNQLPTDWAHFMKAAGDVQDKVAEMEQRTNATCYFTDHHTWDNILKSNVSLSGLKGYTIQVYSFLLYTMAIRCKLFLTSKK